MRSISYRGMWGGGGLRINNMHNEDTQEEKNCMTERLNKYEHLQIHAHLCTMFYYTVY